MSHSHTHEQRTSWVVLITAVTMVVEIIYGLSSKSMALLADGIHMGSHVLAIGLSWIAYIFVRKMESRHDHIADALTSVTAIIGLTAAMFWNIVWLDAACAMLSSFIIVRWSLGLIKDSGKVLLDL